MRAGIVVACAGLLLLTGCASVGPPTIDRDRFDYVTALSDSWKRQILLNLLKVRYADAPVFMDVASVISSYSLEGEISLGGQVAPSGRGNTFGSVGGTGRYADKPTIAYQPLSGAQFASSMLANIPVTGILNFIQSGYPADIALRICVNTINGIENAYGGSGNPRAGSPKFPELMTALREAQAAGIVGFRLKTSKNRPGVVFFIRPLPKETRALRDKIRNLLSLTPGGREFNVVSGPFPENQGEVAIQTRSIMQIMIDFASYVDVPATDIAEGRVFSPQRTAEQERLFPPLLKVRQGTSSPDDAHVAVRYRNRWFWIDDRDLQSKYMLGFLMLTFSLTEAAPTQSAPVVTIPAR